MKTLVSLGVWLYMTLSVVTEVTVFYLVNSVYAAAAAILTIAASQGVAVILFYMDLRDEPTSLRIFALIPLMFLSALFVAMLASLG